MGRRCVSSLLSCPPAARSTLHTYSTAQPSADPSLSPYVLALRVPYHSGSPGPMQAQTCCG
jgi:hypothetical protein